MWKTPVKNSIEIDSHRVACFESTVIYVLEDGTLIVDGDSSSPSLSDQINSFLNDKNSLPVFISSPSVFDRSIDVNRRETVFTCSVIYRRTSSPTIVTSGEALQILEKFKKDKNG